MYKGYINKSQIPMAFRSQYLKTQTLHGD